MEIQGKTQKLIHLDDSELRTFLEFFFSTHQVSISMYSSYNVLSTYFNKLSVRLYIYNFEDVDYLVLKKFGIHLEYRFLFVCPPKRALENFMEEFVVDYLAINLFENKEDFLNDKISETIDDVSIGTNFFGASGAESKKIQKELRYAIRDNSDLKLNFLKFHTDSFRILDFLEKWRSTRTKDMNVYARIENDINLLVKTKDDDKVSIVAFTDASNQIVAYNILEFKNDDVVLSLAAKVLRDRKNMGLYSKYMVLNYLGDKRYKSMIIGAINNDFKKKFLSIDTRKIQNVEYYVSERVKVFIKNPLVYLKMFF